MGQTKYKQQDDLFKINYNNLNDLNTGIVRLNKNEKQHYICLLQDTHCTYTDTRRLK